MAHESTRSGAHQQGSAASPRLAGQGGPILRRAAAGRRELVFPGGENHPDLATGSVLFVGTATVLIRYAGFTILTDPNFLHRGDHVHLGYGMTAPRLTDPALDLDELPPLDFVLLSHLHGDHFDHLVEARLNREMPIVTTPQAAAALRHSGFRRLCELRTWEPLSVIKDGVHLRVTSMPAKHAPGLVQALLPPVMGSMLEFANEAGRIGFRLYITGDTLLSERLRDIARRYPDIDLGLFHLGGTRLFGLLLTMDARQGVEAIRIIKPKKAIPIHYNDYPVFRSPLADFQRAVLEAGLQERVHYLSHGETYHFTVPASRWQS